MFLGEKFPFAVPIPLQGGARTDELRLNQKFCPNSFMCSWPKALNIGVNTTGNWKKIFKVGLDSGDAATAGGFRYRFCHRFAHAFVKSGGNDIFCR